MFAYKFLGSCLVWGSDMLVVGLRVGRLLRCWYNIRIFTVLVLFDYFVSRFYVSYFWDFGLLIIDFLLTR